MLFRSTNLSLIMNTQWLHKTYCSLHPQPNQTYRSIITTFPTLVAATASGNSFIVSLQPLKTLSQTHIPFESNLPVE